MVTPPREELHYLSSFLGRPARSRKLGTSMGRIWDMVATLTGLYPQIRGLVLRHRDTHVLYPATAEEMFGILAGKSLSVDESRIEPLKLGPDDFSLRDQLWDKQVVDVEGAKVVRVNDVHLLVGSRQWVVHVDVGFSGLLRRLGWETPVKGLSGLLGRKITDELISWKFVQIVSTGEQVKAPVRLTVGAQRMADLHPGELADIIEDLDASQRRAVVDAMDVETAAEALEEVDEEVQKSIIESMDPERAADILEEMEPSEAADLLAQLDEEASSVIIEAFEEEEEKAEVLELMGYSEDTAGALMTTDFLEIHADCTVGEAIETVRREAEEVESIYYVYIHDDDGKLIGAVSLRRLIQTDPNLQVGNVIQGRLVSVSLNAQVPEIAETFLRYNFLFLPVVDEDEMLKGVISFKSAFDELLPQVYKQWKAD